MKFTEKLTGMMLKNNSLVCIGLDPDTAMMPAGVSILDFNRSIIEATSDIVCAYKPNFAFYEAQGITGLEDLKKTIAFIPEDIPVIGDAKRGDIGNTARAYAKAVFEIFGCDAATVNPYLGYDSIEPFINYTEKGVFILCRTSNPGAADFQSLISGDMLYGQRTPLFEIVAQKAGEWNKWGNIGLVVGATYPDELRLIRQNHPEMVLLIPGVGAQGGDLATVLRNGLDLNQEGAIINSSRQILYASKGKDFAQAAREAAITLRDQINEYRRVV